LKKCDCRGTGSWKLCSMQSIAQESEAALKELQRTKQGYLTSLQFSGVNFENWDPILVYMCSTKLPKLTLSLWEQSIQNKAEIPEWLELDSFLKETVDSFRSVNFLYVQSKDSNRVAEFSKINSSFIFLQHKGSSRQNHAVVLGRRSYPKETVVLQLLCKQASIPVLHKRSQLFKCQYRHHTLLHRNSGPTTTPIPSDSTHNFVLFRAKFRTKSRVKNSKVPPWFSYLRSWNFIQLQHHATPTQHFWFNWPQAINFQCDYTIFH